MGPNRAFGRDDQLGGFVAVKILQIAQTGSAVQLAAASIYARWVLFQNTGAATATIGDSTVAAGHGALLAATTGQLLLPPLADVSNHYDLSQFWTIGTNTQVLSIVYDSMT
jgi:hypothetical protein